MSDLVRVIVAPGCHVQIAPHPSGVAGMSPLVLFSGNTLNVTPARAAELYAGRLIMHPSTGRLPPLPAAVHGQPTISFEGAPPRPLSDPVQSYPRWEATAEAKAPEPARPHYVVPKWAGSPDGEWPTNY